MTKKLTKDQEKAMGVWRDECIKIGRDTGPVNKEAVKVAWEHIYKKLGKDTPELVWCQSPAQAQALMSIQKSNTTEEIKQLALDMVEKKIGQWRALFHLAKKNNISISHEPTSSWCQHDIAWIGYYMFFIENNIIDNIEPGVEDLARQWFSLAKSCGWCYTFENAVFVCEKPCELNLDDEGRLHKDGGAALRYSDGYSVYSLNGVRVTKEIATTPAGKLDPKLILDEPNVDVQREIIKKIGAEVVLKKLNAKVLDSWVDPNTGCEYELMHLLVGEIDRKYLFYEHASIPGYSYASPVPPETPNAAQGRLWKLSKIDQSKLGNIAKEKENELINELPKKLS